MTETSETKAAVFAQYFREDLVFLDVAWASSDELFHEVASIAQTQGLAHEGYAGALSAREAQYPTGLQLPKVGIAIPHANPVNIQSPFISFIRPAKPIKFGAMGSTRDDVLDASFIFLLGVLNDGLQVTLLQTILGVLGDDVTLKTLASVSTPAEAVAALRAAF